MRVFAISDMHIDYRENYHWFNHLSQEDFTDDILIVAGDVSSDLQLLECFFIAATQKFFKVLYVPGNHEFWVSRGGCENSLEKFKLVIETAREAGAITSPLQFGGLLLVPLFGWYDYSFGQPEQALFESWADYYTCKWPNNEDVREVNGYFTSLNENHIKPSTLFTISFSHFVPRIDLMPWFIPASKRLLYPVLGSAILEKQIRLLKPAIHIYGHSHVNRHIEKEGISYINNAYGYPSEKHITAKSLRCVYND